MRAIYLLSRLGQIDGKRQQQYNVWEVTVSPRECHDAGFKTQFDMQRFVSRLFVVFDILNCRFGEV